MFLEWIKIFKTESLMDEIFSAYMDMIEGARWMFETIAKNILDQGDPARYQKELRDRDRKLNKAERDIRKQIIQHLAINPSRELGTSLVFFSGVKDAERLGDYCKNLQEIAVLQKGEPYPEKYMTRVREIFRTIEAQFSKMANAFMEFDGDMARQIMMDLENVKAECESLVEEIMNGDGSCGITVKGAVATCLTARYCKRVASHITNIASGITNKPHKIDYRPKKKKPTTEE